MSEIVDLRGRPVAPAPAPVLADPSGKRMRLLTRVGRVVAVLFLLWIVGLGLAGLGILPASEVPLGRALASQAPSPLAALPRPKQPSASDLASARPLHRRSTVASTVASTQRHAGDGAGAALGAHGVSRSPRGASGSSPHRGSGTSHRGGGPAASGAAPTPVLTTSQPPTTAPVTSVGAGHGKAAAPGQARKLSAPVRVKTPAAGNSGSAPGAVKRSTPSSTKTIPPTTTTTTPGNSGSAPGQTVTHGNGHGNGD